jgi:hypothetical protein
MTVFVAASTRDGSRFESSHSRAASFTGSPTHQYDRQCLDRTSARWAISLCGRVFPCVPTRELSLPRGESVGYGRVWSCSWLGGWLTSSPEGAGFGSHRNGSHQWCAVATINVKTRTKHPTRHPRRHIPVRAGDRALSPVRYRRRGLSLCEGCRTQAGTAGRAEMAATASTSH